MNYSFNTTAFFYFTGNLFIKKNLFESKSHLLRKIVRWRHKAAKRSTKANPEPMNEDLAPITTTVDYYCNHEDSLLATVSDYEEEDDIEVDVNIDDPPNLKCQRRGYEDENCNQSVFELNISDNFSDSLIECFNTVLQTKAA